MDVSLHDPQTELAALRCAIVDPQLFGNHFEPGDFGVARYDAAWQAGKNLLAAGRPVTFNTFVEELERAGVHEPIDLVNSIFGGSEFPSYIDAYAETIKKWATYRKLLGIGSLLAVPEDSRHAPDVDAMIDNLTGHLARLRETTKAERTGSKTSWTCAELLAAEFPDPVWAVPGIVPVGLTFLAGRPKVGKSWLALQIAQAVGTGGMTFDKQIAPGRVLYLALEDGPRRLKGRLQKQGAPGHADIRFETSWRRFDAGGLDDLRMTVTEGGYSLVVIDTLSRALGRADQSDLADMTMLVGDLQQLAIESDLAILVIDHHRKPNGSIGNPIDDIVGSTAKSAVADAALGLFKEQGKAGAVLKVTGRDIEEAELALSWDAALCCWQLEGTVEEAALRGNKTKVLDALRALHPSEANLSELAVLTGISTNNLHPILTELADLGKIDRLTKQKREVPYRFHMGQEASER